MKGALKKTSSVHTATGQHVKLVHAERVILEQMAAQESLNLSEMVRQLIREAARSRGLWPPKQQD